MAAQNPVTELNKLLFEEPIGLLGIPAHGTRIRLARNLDFASNADHLQQANEELVRRMLLGWRVRPTPATNHHCGLYAVYQGFVALSRRFPLLIPGPVPSLDAVYDWLVRDRRKYQRFVYQHGDFSAVGDLAAFTFVHNFSSEQLDLVATWLGQQSSCDHSIRVIGLLQDRTAHSTFNRHYMVHGRISTPIDTTATTGELYLFVHHAPATPGSLAHWSMFSDRDWEFQAEEDPAILNGSETTTAEDNWNHEHRERLSKPPATRYPPNLPSTERLAWVCGHLTRNPISDYKSEAKPRTEVTPQQLSWLFGLGSKDSNIRKAIQVWREKQKKDGTEAAKWLITDRTASDQQSLLRGKAKPRLVEYQRDLIDLGRFNEATDVDALRQYIDTCGANSAAGSMVPITAVAKKADSPVPSQSAGAGPVPSTPPPPVTSGHGPYYLRSAASSISPGKTYPAPKDRDGTRIRTPSAGGDEEDGTSEEDADGKKKSKKRKRESPEASDGGPPKSPHNSDDGNSGGNGAAAGAAGAQPSAGLGEGQTSPDGSGAGTAGARGGGGAGGMTAPTPDPNIDPQLRNTWRLAQSIAAEPRETSRVSMRRRSWPLYAVSVTQRSLRRERERAGRGTLPSVLAPSDARVSRDRRQRVRFVQRSRRSWTQRIRDGTVEGVIMLGLSGGAYAATRSLMTVDWHDMFTSASEQLRQRILP